MDPLHPIAPGPLSLRRRGAPPVERLEPISRERDRPDRERRRRPPQRESSPPQPEPPEDDGRPHIDVRV